MQVLTSGEQTSTFSPGGSVGPGERPRVCVGERSISKSNGVLLFNLKKSIVRLYILHSGSVVVLFMLFMLNSTSEEDE